ncbi:MAG TPA: calcium-binding protein [Burkholderiaceae bacterium]
MAVITANFALEITGIGFEGDWLNQANTVTLQNGFTSAQGNFYEHALRLNFGDEPSWYDNWCGNGIVFNPVTRAVTAGTLTGVVVTDGGVQQFAVEGFSFSAVAFYNAMVSATPDDDLAMVRSMLSGSDTFNLSPQSDNVWGWTGNDTMRGNVGNDTLYGDAGNDWLDGGAGNDLLYGGTGNDTYVVNSASDVVNELAGGGTDTVRSGVTRTLGSNQENLVLIGTGAINGTGNTLANVLTGNAAANTLNGSSGIDQMAGGAGNDTYVVDNAGDVVTEAAAAGTDTVRSSTNRTLGSNQENLVLIGTGAINGNGNTLANVLTGNAAANSLNGSSGNDRLSGGAGNDLLNGSVGSDTLSGGTGLDQFRFTNTLNGTTNVDSITDFVSADDRFVLDDAVFAGVGAVGALAAAAFRAGAAAADASDRVIYNSATGALSFDADGNGAGAAVVFATLIPGTSVVLGDFFII